MKDILGAGELSSNSLELMKIIYPDLAQPSVKKVGAALEMTIDFLTIPIKYLGAIGKRYDINIQKSLKEYQEKLDAFSIEEIGTVPPEVGVPLIEDLTRVTNEELASIYVNLLVNSSLVENSKFAHPSFLTVLRSLSQDEAKIIQLFCNGRKSISFIRYQRIDLDGSIVPMPRYYTNINDLVELSHSDNDGFYITNLEKLGIIEKINTYLQQELHIYDELELKYQSVKENMESSIKNLDDSNFIKQSKLEAEKGRFIITRFGEQFIKSISL